MRMPATSRRPAILLAILMFATPSVAADLGAKLRPMAERHRGKVGLAVEHLGTGESFAFNADEPMPTASLIKFPIMVEAYRQAEEGKLDLDAKVVLDEADKVPGSGVLTTRFSGGAEFSVRDAIRLMIADSDNTATNLVLDRIGLPATAATMEALGLPNTKAHGKLYRRGTSVFPERSNTYGIGSTTAGEMIRLLKLLHAKELVDAEASEAMLEHMRHCADDEMLPRLLPGGTVVAQKTGFVGDIRTAAGIIESPGGPIAVCVLTSESRNPDAAVRLIAEVAREAYNHFNRADPEAVSEVAALTSGSSGPAVEALQRALNARLDPSPGLGVDGEFGPATEAAVRQFQAKNNLPATGVADARTQKTLGPPPGEEPVPPPAEVNARVLEREPADDLDAPPFVTARTWVVYDPRSGEIVAGSDADRPVEMASTTKIMTALVVLRLARDDPSVLDEVVTFNDRADGTGGSTSGVRAGERVSARELLYGLLLPSGNDASVALGEHFGNRLAPPAEGPDEADPLRNFVAEMNRVAAELGLVATRFDNTHGLPSPTHRSSALDLAKLAATALADPTFAEVVGTRQRGATLLDARGGRRDVVWSNTNKLLAVEGFDGVKTGTTSGAGACLVASGRRGDDRLIIVVLGSGSSDGRYADARNLFRWAWTRRAAAATR